ncbi:MAG: LemA family protein [Traorella sp.]
MWILLVVVILVIIWGVMTYNSFISLRNKVEEAYSTMDVYLKKRYDLIPNLVETVKGYAKHEKETLTQVIEARNVALQASNAQDKLAAEKKLNQSMMNLFALSEQYPDLKANQNFMNLQNELKNMEGEIANARKYYNAIVRNFNTKCEAIPSNIIANLAHFEKQPLFEVETPEERGNVKVSF